MVEAPGQPQQPRCQHRGLRIQETLRRRLLAKEGGDPRDIGGGQGRKRQTVIGGLHQVGWKPVEIGGKTSAVIAPRHCGRERIRRGGSSRGAEQLIRRPGDPCGAVAVPVVAPILVSLTRPHKRLPFIADNLRPGRVGKRDQADRPVSPGVFDTDACRAEGMPEQATSGDAGRIHDRARLVQIDRRFPVGELRPVVRIRPCGRGGGWCVLCATLKISVSVSPDKVFDFACQALRRGDVKMPRHLAGRQPDGILRMVQADR